MNHARIQRAIIVWFSIYPLITVIQFLFGEQLSVLPLPLRTFVVTIVLVPLMTFIFIPFWTRVLTPIFNRQRAVQS